MTIPFLSPSSQTAGSVGVTPPISDDSTKLATTAFVKEQGYLISDPDITHVSQVAHGLLSGQAVYYDGTIWVKAQANAPATLGIGVVSYVDADNFNVFINGLLTGLSGLTPGQYYFVSDATPGLLTSTEPTASASYSNPLLFATSTTTGMVVQFRPSQVANAGGSLILDGNLVLPKTSGTGIELDTASPSFGWRDIIGDINSRGTGTNDPPYVAWSGNIYAYSFSASTMQQFWAVYHVPHDYVPDTAVYFHMHWSNPAVTPSTGNVVWGWEYTWAKGFNQMAFGATATTTVTQACPATSKQHCVAETNAITLSGLEADSIIMVRVYRDATNVADTCTNAVFAHTADVHYQSTNLATKHKAPNFYA